MSDPVQFSPKLVDWVGAFLAVSVTTIVAVQTIAPYFYDVPTANSATVGQQQTMFQTVFIMIVSFFFASSASTRQKDATINTLSNTAAQVATTAAVTRAAMSPNDKVIPLSPGESATVKADEPVKETV